MRLLAEGKETTFEEPKMPRKASVKDEDMPFVMKKYERDLDRIEKVVLKYKENKGKLYTFIKGRWSVEIEMKIKSHTVKFEEMEKTDNVVVMKDLIQEIIFSTEEGLYYYWKLTERLIVLVNTRRKKEETEAEFLERWSKSLSVFEEIGGPMCPGKETGDDEKTAREKFLACMFLKRCGEQFQPMRDELKNQFAAGQKNYPKNVDEVMTRLNVRADKSKFGSHVRQHARSFVQMQDRTCFKCGKQGHIAKFCPENKGSGDDSSVSSNGSVVKWSSQGSKSSKGSKSGKTICTQKNGIEWSGLQKVAQSAFSRD